MSDEKSLALERDERVLVFFVFPDDKTCYVDTPYCLLSDIVKALEQKVHNFVPIVEIRKKKYYYGESGSLRLLFSAKKRKK